MKVIIAVVFAALCTGSMACRAGKGCPTNGKNVGAERILSGDLETMKAVKKAPKFKS